MTKGISSYSRDQIKQYVQDGICPVQTLRDYDIVMQAVKGKKVDDIVFEYEMKKEKISRAQVFNIIKKYK